MKKILGTLLLVIALFTVAACSDKKIEDYELVIPKEADVVVSAQINNIVTKSELAKSPLFAVAKGHLDSMLGSGMRDLTESVINDPSLTGISFESPVYLFGIKGSIWGVTMKINDESLTEKFIKSLSDNGLCGKVKQHDGLSWTTFLDDINIVYSDNTLLCLLQTQTKSRMNNETFMLSLMELEEEAAFVTTDKFTEMTEKSDGDLSLYMNFAAFPGIQDTADGIVPSWMASRKLEMIAGMNINNKDLAINASLFSSDSIVQKQIDAYFHGFKPIKGDYTNHISSDNHIWACLGMDGKKMIDVMKSVPKLKEMLLGANLGIDADNMIRSISGDVLVCINQLDKSNANANDIKVYAQLDNTDFMKDVNYWIKSAKDYGLTLSSLSNHDYLLRSDDMNLYWAVNGKELYLGTQRYEALGVYPAGTSMDEIMGNLMYVYVNLADDNPIFSHAIIKTVKSGEFIVDIHMNDLKKNLLNGFLNSLWKQ